MVNVFNELCPRHQPRTIYFIENMTPEISLAALKTFDGFIYSFARLIACDHGQRNLSKVFNRRIITIAFASSSVTKILPNCSKKKRKDSCICIKNKNRVDFIYKTLQKLQVMKPIPDGNRIRNFNWEQWEFTPIRDIPSTKKDHMRAVWINTVPNLQSNFQWFHSDKNNVSF